MFLILKTMPIFAYFKTHLPLHKLISARTLSTCHPVCSVKPFSEIPGPRPLPLIGNMWRYLPIIGNYKVDSLFENGQYNLQKYGPIVREVITNQHTILHLFDPNDIESLFRQDSRYPMRRSHRALLKYRHDRPHQYVDGGLFPENNQNWHRQRIIFQSYFSKSKVASVIDKISIATNQLVEQSHRKKVPFEKILYRWALNNSLLIFLNCDVQSLENSFVNKCIDELHRSLLGIEHTEIYSQKWLKNPDKCPFYKMLSNSQDFLYEFVFKRIQLWKDSDSELQKNCFLKEFLLVSKINPKDVTSFVIDTLMAGLHTTSYVAAHLLYHICNTQGIQEAVQKEIDSVFKSTDPSEPITFEQVESLTLLKNCLKETLRLNPVSIGTGRVSHKDLNIRGYKIPAGTMIITQNQVISRNPQVFSDPDSFNPNRWLQKNKSNSKEPKPSPFASLPFGFGPRACIGKRLAELQIKLLTAKLLSSFNVVHFKKIPTKTTLVHVFDGHLEVEFRKRIKIY